MAEVKRKRATFSLDMVFLEALEKLSKKTNTPQGQILERACIDKHFLNNKKVVARLPK